MKPNAYFSIRWLVLCAWGLLWLPRLGAAQVTTTETFETTADGSFSFTSNGQAFNISSPVANNVFNVQDLYAQFGVTYGWNGTAADRRLITNNGGTGTGGNNGLPSATSSQFTISTANATGITVKSFYVRLASTNDDCAGSSGTFTVAGKRAGSQVYTASVATTALRCGPNNAGTLNGYNLIDLASFGGANNSNVPIDQLTITSSGTANTFLLLDAFRFATLATATAPTVTTTAASALTSTSATLGGNVTSDGSSPITERGVVYVAGTGTPTTSNTKLTASGTTGSYTVSATGLSAGTQYTARAYATNSQGTSYGSAVSFTTAAALAASISSQTNVSCFGGSNGAATAAASGGVAPYTYSWSTSPAQTTATATGLAAGTYTVTVTDAASQTTTATATITQPTALAATTSQTNVTTNGGSNGTATVSVSGGTSPYTYSWSTSPAQTTATATGLAAGTYTVTVTDANGCSIQRTFTITQPVAAPADLVVSTGSSASPTTVPTGTYNSITVTGTGYAQLGGAVVVNSTVAVQNGGTLNTNCQSLTGAASFTLADGGTLVICDAAGITSSGATGAVQVTGTRSFSTDANYVYNGTATQTTGSGLPAQVRNLTSTNSNTVTLSQALAIRQVLALNAGSFLTNGQTLTLLSDATGTALVANLSNGQVSGTVTVQRYLDGTTNPGLGYRHLATPVNGATVAAFGSGGTAPVVNSAYNSAANPQAVTPFPTVFSYDQSRLASSPATTLSAFDKGWLSPASTTTSLSLAFTGYTVQLPGASTLSFVGSVVGTSGSIPMSRASGATAADAGLSLIGNPYPSPLDFSTIPASQRTNVDAAFYVFESTSQYGGQYRSYVNYVGNPLIGTAQAFFARVTSGSTSGSLALSNANRVTTYGQQAPVRRTTSLRPLVQLDLRGQNLTDTFTAYAEAGATAAFDSEYDATKLPNSNGLNLGTTAGSVEALAIDGRPAFTAATSFPLTVGVPAAGTYTFTAAQLANLPAGLTAYLYDAATGSATALSAGSVYSFQVTAAQAAAPVAGRFTLQFSPAAPLAAAPAALAAQVSVFPNPAHEQVTVGLPGIAGATAVQAELLNALGQVVRRHEAALPAAGTAFGLPTAGLAPGVYVLRLTAGATLIAKRLTVQ